MRTTTLRNERFCLERVERTVGHYERMKGLLGKKQYPAGHVMWFCPCASIHTFFMQFPIDVIFLSRDLVITDVRMGVRPWQVVIGSRRAYSVLEAQTGWLEKPPIAIGMQFEAIDH